MTDRRTFLRQGSLWLAGAALLGPEALERLTWRRKSFALGGALAPAGLTEYNQGLVGFGDIMQTQRLYFDITDRDGGLIAVPDDYVLPAHRNWQFRP